MSENFRIHGLHDNLLKALDDLGFVEPTPIQAEVISVILQSKLDIVALAQTGTGKTAAFGLPLIQLIDHQKDTIQTLVLAPTRELCIQICKDIISYSKYSKNVSTVPVFGGANILNQIKAIKKSCQIVVATPGRALDLIKRRVLKLNNIENLVLDEADEMLNMGFKDELDAILEATPSNKRTFLFSATMPRALQGIMRQFLNEYKEISVSRRNLASSTIEHHYYVVHARDKYKALKRIADFHPNVYAIIFCRTRRDTQDVATKLIADGYNADSLHGDLSQIQRDKVMDRFRLRLVQLLVATDVAARGLDVDHLSHVINYSIPDDVEVYIHRSGRTGRAGRSGISLTITHMREYKKLESWEKTIGKPVTFKKIPLGEEICQKQVLHLVDKVVDVEVDHKHIDRFLPSIFTKLEGLDREELIKHFVSQEFNRFLNYYKKEPDINAKIKADSSSSSNSRTARMRSGDNELFSRYKISVGSEQHLNPVRLIGLINDLTSRRDIPIGSIKIKKHEATFEVLSTWAPKVQASFGGVQVDNIDLDLQFLGEGYSEPTNSSKQKTRAKSRRSSSPRQKNRKYHR